MWNFSRIGHKTKSYGLRKFRHEGCLNSPAWDNPENVWINTFLHQNLTSHVALKSSRSWSLNIQFQKDWPKQKKITAILGFCLKTYKNFAWLSLELNDAPLEELTIFLYCSSFGPTALQSCRLDPLKNAIFSRTGCNTKKLRRLKHFLSTVFKHGLLEWTTFSLQYRAITHTLLESSRFGELRYAILAE